MATFLELATNELSQTLLANSFAGQPLETKFGVGSVWRRPGLPAYVEVYRTDQHGTQISRGADPMEVWVCREGVPLAKRVSVSPYPSFMYRLVATINDVSGASNTKARKSRQYRSSSA